MSGKKLWDMISLKEILHAMLYGSFLCFGTQPADRLEEQENRNEFIGMLLMKWDNYFKQFVLYFTATVQCST